MERASPHKVETVKKITANKAAEVRNGDKEGHGKGKHGEMV